MDVGISAKVNVIVADPVVMVSVWDAVSQGVGLSVSDVENVGVRVADSSGVAVIVGLGVRVRDVEFEKEALVVTLLVRVAS